MLRRPRKLDSISRPVHRSAAVGVHGPRGVVTRGLTRCAWMATFSLSLVFAEGDARADIYTYTDANGVVHFQNRAKKGKVYAKAKKKARRSPRAVLPTEGSSERSHRYDPIIREAATLYQIPEALVRAVIKVESNFDPRAVSHANARGLMQLIPPTAERMMVTDIFDPRQNIFGGVRYLRVLANLFNGNLELTVAAYNAGENAVMRHGGIPPYPETQDYVVRVLQYYRLYRASPPAGP